VEDGEQKYSKKSGFQEMLKTERKRLKVWTFL